MNNTVNILLFVVVANLLVGGFVLITNPIRTQNRLFFIFLILMAFWSSMVMSVLGSPSAEKAAFSIRLANGVGVALALAFHFLCFSIILEDNRVSSIFRKSWLRVILAFPMAALAMSPWTIQSVVMPGSEGTQSVIPVPVYNNLINAPVQAFIILSFISTIWKSIRFLKRLEGIRRAELQFTLLGVACGVAIAFFLVLALPLLFRDMVPQQFGPFCVLPINLIIAYGIATHRIMDVPAFLQRITAYSLLAVYLTILYIVVHFSSTFFISMLGESPKLISHMLAAVIVAFSMSPMQGFLQKLSHKLFINQAVLDIREAARKSNEIFASVSTVDAILSRFVSILHSGGIDAEPLLPLLSTKQDLRLWELPSTSNNVTAPLCLPFDSPLVTHLRENHTPLSMDTVKRRRPSMKLINAANEMERVGVQLAVAIVFKDTLHGLVLFGPRQSGRIYSVSEQDALQVLCNQLAVALENASLYTEVQNNKIYNDILVDNLVNGVVAVDREGIVTVFNREAQRITNLPAREIIGFQINLLPQQIRDALHSTLNTGQSIRDQEIVLPSAQAEDGESLVRMGSSLFHSATDDILGALLVMSDLTVHKKLEMQVRQSDRLASIGTLSAGVAHEIKNHLVTIKTFTELLPERYNDSDFRDTFSELVGHEVKRIDGLVNQLLHFARPAKATLNEVQLHTILGDSLRLVQEQLKQKQITLHADTFVEDAIILADTNLFGQALINFFLQFF